MRFKDYVVCVVGGTGGIGFSIAQSFLEEGAIVYVHGRDQDKLTKRLKTLSQYGERVRGIQADLVSEDDRKRFLLGIDHINRLDVLICAVGNGNVVRGSNLTEDDCGVVFGQNFLTSSLIKHLKTLKSFRNLFLNSKFYSNCGAIKYNQHNTNFSLWNIYLGK